jgi:trigger factor
VNVTVENLAPCKKLLRVELDAKAVDAAFDAVTKDFQKQAALPGFRPGKAPRAMVLKKYEADIKDEVKRKLIGDAYRKAVEEKKISVVGHPDIEEIQFGRGQALQFAATIETAPEFQLPEYKGLPAKREIKSVTDADVERALDLLAQQHVKFETVARELRLGDIAVVNYTGTCDGKPITELAPTAKGLTEQKNFWVESGLKRSCPVLPLNSPAPGRRQAHGQRGFSRRFRDEGTRGQERGFRRRTGGGEGKGPAPGR